MLPLAFGNLLVTSTRSVAASRISGPPIALIASIRGSLASNLISSVGGAVVEGLAVPAAARVLTTAAIFPLVFEDRIHNSCGDATEDWGCHGLVTAWRLRSHDTSYPWLGGFHHGVDHLWRR